MTHQVNLKTKDLVPGYGPIQLNTFLLVLAASIAISGLWIFLNWAERQSLEADHERWTTIVIENEAKLEAFTASNPNQLNETELQAENQRLSLEKQRVKESYEELVTYIVDGAANGFSSSLNQLSDLDIEGVWLDQVLLQEGNRYVSLGGFARNPELIPSYIERLGSSYFEGISIDNFAVEKQEGETLWRFFLSNNGEQLGAKD